MFIQPGEEEGEVEMDSPELLTSKMNAEIAKQVADDSLFGRVPEKDVKILGQTVVNGKHE